MEEKPQTQKNSDNLKTVRTYMTDMADTVRQNEISVIKVALAEQNRHEREDLYRKIEGTTAKKIFWVIGGIILIAGAIYGSSFLFKEKAKKEAPPEIIKKEDTIIPYEEISSLNLKDGEDLASKISEIKKEKSSTEKTDVIKFIQISKDLNGVSETMNTEEIFAKMKFTAPASMVRSLTDSYMIGTYTKNIPDATTENIKTPGLFMIFQTKDYGYTYAGMLEWEKTMGSDMYDLFRLNTSDSKEIINNRPWKDLIINNKDARVLFNEDNKGMLYYVITTKNNLVITDNAETIREINARLITTNVKTL